MEMHFMSNEAHGCLKRVAVRTLGLKKKKRTYWMHIVETYHMRALSIVTMRHVR